MLCFGISENSKAGRSGWTRWFFGKKKRPWWVFPLRIFLFFFAVWMVLVLVVRQPTIRGSARSEVAVEPAVLEGHVRVLAEEFVPRNMFHIGNTARTEEYIRLQLDEAVGKAGRTELIPFHASGRDYRLPSLVLGETLDAPRLVVGAHYDAFDRSPGADDNASGVAGVIELARLLAPHEDELVRPVEFVCYAREEPPAFNNGSMGSGFHARMLSEGGDGCRLMICVEMIGFYSDESGSQGYPVRPLALMYPSRGNFLAVVGNTDHRGDLKRAKIAGKGATELPLYSISAPSAIPGIDFSDHRNYWSEGYPAIMYTDTAFYRNENYHKATDTPDTLDYERMAMAVVAIHEAVKAFALGEQE